MVQLSGSPCNECGMRHVGCRWDCKHYTAYHARAEAMRAERLRENGYTYAATETARKKEKRHTDKWGGDG